MNIISEIERHEMERRWAIGEVYSKIFHSEDPVLRKETLALLESGDRIKEEEGIRRHQCRNRGIYINSIPQDTEWFLASLPIIESEFRKFKTIKDKNWYKYSDESYLFLDAANHLIKNPCEDTRVTSIIEKLIDRKVEMMGITFISEIKNGSYYIIAEGTARLVAIYYHCILNGVKLFEDNTIEVVLGVSKTKWRYSPC